MQLVERAAERVLETVPAWIWDGERLPVPVEDVVDSVFGLLVRESGRLADVAGAPSLAPGQSLSGLLLADRGEIWVDASEARQSPGRRRFTIGHELGHWCMHRTDRQSSFCRAGSVVEDGSDAVNPVNETGEAQLPQLEEQANVFAAALLMPGHLVEREYRHGRFSRDGDFFALCRRFGVSGAAMGRRLHTVI